MKYILFAFLLIAVLFWGCADKQDDGLISIEIHFDPGIRLQPMTMTPDIPLAVTEYRVYGLGPVSTSFDMMVGGSTCVVEDILPGEWVITAEGFNDEGTMLLYGEITTVLDEVLSETTIQLTEPAGEGTLKLSFSWESGFVSEPAVSAVLLSSDGTAIPLNLVVGDGTAAADATLESGLFELSARLYDGDEQVAGAADYIKIIPGEETAGLVDFNIVLTPISPGLTLEAPYLTPLEVTITGYETPLFTGTPAVFRGVTDTEVPSEFKWFVDGVLVATGEEYSLETSAAGTRRIDLLSASDGYATGGSVTLEVSVHEPIFYGSLVFIEGVFDNQDGADGLSDVRGFAVWENYLYTAGYGEDEIGVYEIATDTGKLSFLNVLDGVPGPGSIDGPSCLVSGDSLGGVGFPWLAAACSGNGSLVLFSIDPDTGELLYRDAVTPSVGGYSIPGSGPPDLPADANPLAGAAGIAAAPDGVLIAVSSIESDTITSYIADGSALAPYQIITQGTLSSEGYDGSLLDGPEEMAISADGSILAVACRFSDTVLLFEIDEIDSLLSPVGAYTDGVDDIDGLNGTAGVSFSPDGRHIYATGYYDNSVALFEKIGPSGSWAFIDVWKEDDLPGIALHYPRGIAVSRDGSEVYVCAGGSDAFTVFSRDAASGALSAPVSAVNGDERTEGLDGIRRVASAGEGEYVYAVSSNDDAVALFRRE